MLTDNASDLAALNILCKCFTYRNIHLLWGKRFQILTNFHPESKLSRLSNAIRYCETNLFHIVQITDGLTTFKKGGESARFILSHFTNLMTCSVINGKI